MPRKKPKSRKITIKPYRVPALKGRKLQRRFNPDKLPKRDKDGRFVKKPRRKRTRKKPAPAPALPGLTGPQGSLF